MAADTATFILAYPEFQNAGTSVLTAALAQAETLTSDSFGAQRDVVIYLTMADALARSPIGRDAKLVDDEQTVYQHTLDRLKVANAVTASRLGSR
jgi:hypothetical protein